MDNTLLGEMIFNTLSPRQNGRQFPEDIFKCIFFNEHIHISIRLFQLVQLTIF